MAVRSIGSVTLALGLVTIPLRLYTAQKRHDVSLHRLDRATGVRVRQPTISAVTGEPLESDAIVLAYEHTPGEHVVLEKAELARLELLAESDRIAIARCAPAATIPFCHVVRTTWLGPNKGGERAYSLLAQRLHERGDVAIGKWGGRTRDAIIVLEAVVVRAGDGDRYALAAHELLHEDEVLAGTLAEIAPPRAAGARELELLERILAGLSAPTVDQGIEARASSTAARADS